MHKQPGFTLIEVILVIAIVAGLASAVIVSVNPEKRLQGALTSQLEENSALMTKAVNLQAVDNFAVPNGIPASGGKDICKQGMQPTARVIVTRCG